MNMIFISARTRGLGCIAGSFLKLMTVLRALRERDSRSIPDCAHRVRYICTMHFVVFDVIEQFDIRESMVQIQL